MQMQCAECRFDLKCYNWQKDIDFDLDPFAELGRSNELPQLP
jgi:hypothetical protein